MTFWQRMSIIIRRLLENEDEPDEGSAAIELGALTASGAGYVAGGIAAITLGSVALSGTGTGSNNTADITLGALTSSGAGYATGGDAPIALGSLTMVANGTSTVTGTGSITLAPMTALGTSGAVDNTWAGKRLLSTNMGENLDFTTRVPINTLHQSRGFKVPGTYTEVALKSDGYPVSGTTCDTYFLTAAHTSEAGDYLFECIGDETDLVGLGCTVTNLTYNAGTDKTTAKLTATGAFTGMGIQFRNVGPNFGGVKLMQKGYSTTETALFTPAALHHYSPFNGVIRFMDWLQTNGGEQTPGGNQDTDWATSRASRGLNDARARHGLEYAFAFAGACDADPWTNVPARFTYAALTSYVAAGMGFLQAGHNWYIERPANEPWNGSFQQYTDLRTAAFAAAEVKAGADITNLDRSGLAITARVGSGHGRIAGDSVYVRQKNNLFAAGLRTLTGVTATTVTWNDTGSGTDGAVAHADDATFIFLNPSNDLAKQVTAFHVPDPWPISTQVLYRYHMTLAYEVYQAAAAIGAADRIRPIYGVWMDSLFNYIDAMFWAAEKYGNLDWLYAMSPALYLLPANPSNCTTTDLVFSQLETARTAIVLNALKWGNVQRSMNMHLVAYEGLEHTNDFAGNSAAFIAAHADDRMRVLNKNLMQDWRNRGGEVMCGFFSGWRKAITNGLESWVDVVGDFSTGDTQAKHKVWTELATESANGVQIDGVNFGDIVLTNVFLGGFQPTANGQFYCDATKQTPTNGYAVNICVNTDATYTIKFDAAKVSGTVPASLLVDGVVVATGNLPTVASVFSGPKAGEAFSVSVPLTAGNHTVALHLPNPTRAGQVAVYRARVL